MEHGATMFEVAHNTIRRQRIQPGKCSVFGKVERQSLHDVEVHFDCDFADVGFVWIFSASFAA